MSVESKWGPSGSSSCYRIINDSGLLLQLGATCHAKVTEDVTHVVSSAKDTDKMHWAKRHNRHRVSVNWLYVSGMNLWQLYHLSRALSGDQAQGLFGSYTMCQRVLSGNKPQGLFDSCIICQGPFSSCTLCQGPCKASSPKDSLVAVSSAKGSLVAVSSAKGPVRQQAPSPLTLEPCAYELVLMSLCLAPCTPCTHDMTMSVMHSLLCSLCLHCQSVHVRHWFAPFMSSDNGIDTVSAKKWSTLVHIVQHWLLVTLCSMTCI